VEGKLNIQKETRSCICNDPVHDLGTSVLTSFEMLLPCSNFLLWITLLDANHYAYRSLLDSLSSSS